ncbi:MAG: hypothetical protein PHC97_00905 [Patescibacteria group bacterium]|nr:hypothetical protein [Patescibacteria group bacterium]
MKQPATNNERETAALGTDWRIKMDSIVLTDKFGTKFPKNRGKLLNFARAHRYFLRPVAHCEAGG